MKITGTIIHTIFKCISVALAVLLISAEKTSCDSQKSTSLFSYTGNLTTPSAYITDAKLNFSYSYFSMSFPINENISKKKSEIWAFTANLGLFPFLECFITVNVQPSYNINHQIPNYGADKWRSSGIKIKILKENKSFPALAIGVTDPNIHKLGAKISSPDISSSYFVISKGIGTGNNSFSFGYGSDYFSKNTKSLRLNGFFCGFNIKAHENLSILCDYDGKLWNGGFNINVKKIHLMVSYTEGNYLASRIGYGFNLLNKNRI
ncbi:YjbH domain-containing protein [Candidatus Latescibacterota bacterium]